MFRSRFASAALARSLSSRRPSPVAGSLSQRATVSRQAFCCAPIAACTAARSPRPSSPADLAAVPGWSPDGAGLDAGPEGWRPRRSACWLRSARSSRRFRPAPGTARGGDQQRAALVAAMADIGMPGHGISRRSAKGRAACHDRCRRGRGLRSSCGGWTAPASRRSLGPNFRETEPWSMPHPARPPARRAPASTSIPTPRPARRAAMKEAMMRAEVGDEQHGDDPDRPRPVRPHGGADGQGGGDVPALRHHVQRRRHPDPLPEGR